jgi:hypothetical protein
MSQRHYQDEEFNEHTRLLDARVFGLGGRSSGRNSRKSSRACSIISSHVSKDEHELAGTAVGERLPYNDYTTIDWLHDLVGISPMSYESLTNIYLRLRIPTVTEQSTPILAYKVGPLRFGTPVKDGLQPP